MDGHRLWTTITIHFFNARIWDKRWIIPLYFHPIHVCLPPIYAAMSKRTWQS